MRKCIIKLEIVLLLCFLVGRLEAENHERDSLRQLRLKRKLARLECRSVRLKERLDDYHSWWQNLIPKYQKLQYAGSIGFLSMGVGWDYGRQKQWETDVLLGFVPRFSSEEAKLTFTVKQNYIPWRLSLRERWQFEPLATGVLLNTVFDDDFWGKEPEKYPNGYYNFSTKVRLHLFLGQRFTLEMRKPFPFKSITFYYELSSCDLYIISMATNSYLRPRDVLSFSLGVKLQIL